MKSNIPSPSPDEAKSQLREKLKRVREQVDPALAEAASQGVWNIFNSLPEFHRAKAIGAFASTPSEINTYSILEGTLKLGKKLYLPRVVKDKTHFDYYPVHDFKQLAKGAFGILEPVGHHPAAWEELDMVLVPGLAFDKRGNRLGFGKGYYDRILPLLGKSALSIGLAYSFQMVDQVPVTPEDVPVKALLSEKGFWFCAKNP
jgi:5-formyltetrahydrofolate cyclo-ligase